MEGSIFAIGARINIGDLMLRGPMRCRECLESH